MSRNWRVGDHEYQYLKEVLDSGFPGSSSVSFLARLEAAFAEKFACRYAISHANGTATLHSALAAAGVRPGDEVIVPPLTMASTSLAVLHQQAVPVFADIDPETFLIDPASIRERITPRTKAIIPVALYGLPPDMDPIMQLAAERSLTVIQDAAQCFLGRYKGKVIGSIAHLASFSFQNSKHITCGEGGMVTTNDQELADRVARFASLGYGLVSAGAGKSKIDKRAIVNPRFKRHTALGFNYRMSELSAAVLLAQLERLDDFVAWRRRAAAAFEQVVREVSWLAPQRVPDACEHSYWAYAVRLDAGAAGPSWEQFYDKFAEFGGEGFYGAWSLTYLEPIFQDGTVGKKYPAGLCPVAESVQPRLMQFKTNYGDQDAIDRQAEALSQTIRFFN
jgi:perosamine synthetase